MKSLFSAATLAILSLAAVAPPSRAAASGAEAPPASAPPASDPAGVDVSTPEGVFAALADELRTTPLTPEQLSAARATIDAAIGAAPNDARWITCQAVLMRGQGKNQDVADLMEKAVKLAPDNPRVQMWYGTSIFENMDNIGMFGKLGAAERAEEAYLKAIELDPKYATPHQGLVQFYANAPGIAGGSLKKARKHAAALMAIGGRFTSDGHTLMAMIAAKDEDWDLAASEHRLASETALDAAGKARALGGLGLMLVRDRGDAQAALKVAEELGAVAPADDTTRDFIRGLAHQKLEQHAEAAADFRRVIEKNPNAVNSRFALGECLEKSGDKAGAAEAFEAFAAKFPSDKRAGDAASRAKKLRKSLNAR